MNPKGSRYKRNLNKTPRLARTILLSWKAWQWRPNWELSVHWQSLDAPNKINRSSHGSRRAVRTAPLIENIIPIDHRNNSSERNTRYKWILYRGWSDKRFFIPGAEENKNNQADTCRNKRIADCSWTREMKSRAALTRSGIQSAWTMGNKEVHVCTRAVTKFKYTLPKCAIGNIFWNFRDVRSSRETVSAMNVLP